MFFSKFTLKRAIRPNIAAIYLIENQRSVFVISFAGSMLDKAQAREVVVFLDALGMIIYLNSRR